MMEASPEIIGERHAQISQVKSLQQVLLPVESLVTDMDSEGKRSEVNEPWIVYTFVLAGIRTSGLSLCVFTESTPK